MQRSNFLSSFRHAWAGIAYVVCTQRNARIHLAVAVVVIGLGLWVGLTLTQWAVVAVVAGMVLAAEWLNTAVEAIVDLATPDYHPLAKVAKDAAAGAVLLTAIIAVVVGVLLLVLPIVRWLLMGHW
jgi:diacylglycerol kinase